MNGSAWKATAPSIRWAPAYPSHFEVDDALDTAKAMGARVICSQTMGDSIGNHLSIEPKLGEFNPEAFKHLDYVLKAAHDRGLRLIITLVGDCAYCPNSGAGEYFSDPASANLIAFFTDPTVIAGFEQHIAALLNHKNSLTGIAYKDDPTILAWENCNSLGEGLVLTGGGNLAVVVKWVDVIGEYIKSIDKRHLYEDNSGLLFSGIGLDTETPDIITSEYYPHWSKVFGLPPTAPESIRKDAALVTSHGKVYVVNEFGWDNTDWATRGDLEQVLTTLKNASKISGDLFWALQAHNDKFGWQPIPANVPDKEYDIRGESGQWWALYYGGINTQTMTEDDMATRAELLRSHAFEMAGLAVPPHAVPPAPVITLHGIGDVICWRGSAGAVRYTIERKESASAPWQVICDKCATDADTPWVDPKPASGISGRIYRVTAYNADGKPSAPSAER